MASHPLYIPAPELPFQAPISSLAFGEDEFYSSCRSNRLIQEVLYVIDLQVSDRGMGNTASGRVNSKVPGYLANILSTGDENLTPVPVIEPVNTILTAAEIVMLFNPTDPPPTPARTTGWAICPVFHGTPSDYMTTEFLKRCFTCKREFRQRVDIYMYKDLPFCSDECRNKEMEKDIEEEMKEDDDMEEKMRSRKNARPKRTIFFIGEA
ncbi:hypothetical protein L2E82_02518 [Cichorium intybus]|uniref:Uncharacterized protein n=1 Tax=Cichorium intybus TaxID=13427 RepID=A0ACB9H2Y4_CICIN|nr:hypothetical protein L2E82_02518 [Cichorium intybus]